ncbi:MAG: DNA polymerase III subunit delta [Clostridiales bacterium]|nr:DNA polymerase III subunit delta [Clostridiales bacterium]
MAYKDFVNDKNKGILRDVLFFYGAEDFLMEWAAESIISEYVEEEMRYLDVVRLEGEAATAADIMAEARAYSMFSDKRIVVVRNFLPLYRGAKGPNAVVDPHAEEMLEFAASPQEQSIVIFVLESRFSPDLTAYGRKLAKACSAYEFSRLERVDLKSFITKRVHSAGKVISRRDLEHIIDISGYYNRGSVYDLAQFDRDISKMVKASGTGDISAQLIEEIFIGDSDRFVFNLVDALVAGDRNKSLAIAEAIIRDEDGAMAVLALLTKQFEIMYDSLELSEQGYSMAQMAKKTGVNEYRFKKAFVAAQRYSIQRLRKILIDIYNADRDIKRGDIDKDTALELIAVSACPQ